MSRYILLQYKHSQIRHQNANVLGTLNDLPRAQATALSSLDEINEIIDLENWQVVWSAIKGHTRLGMPPQRLKNQAGRTWYVACGGLVPLLLISTPLVQRCNPKAVGE